MVGVPTPLNGTTCEDKNECLVNNGDCEQGCENTVGSYECTCPLGYQLMDNGRACNGNAVEQH